jgi:hypothetical protein
MRRCAPAYQRGPRLRVSGVRDFRLYVSAYARQYASRNASTPWHERRPEDSDANWWRTAESKCDCHIPAG